MVLFSFGCQRFSQDVVTTNQSKNLVLIVVDTLRASHLHSYGYPLPTSPNLDQLASQGTRFSEFYSHSPWTRPSMATLLTGLYPRTTGIHEERYDRLPSELNTLAETLHEQGFFTINITANPNINEVFGFNQGFDVWMDSTVVFKFMDVHEGQTRFNRRDTTVDNAKQITTRTIETLKTHKETLLNQPFYLQLLYIDPHYPYRPPANHRAPFNKKEGVPYPGYDGEIHFTDQQIGRLLKRMTKMGLMDDTVIVVTSDHGEGLKDHPELLYSGNHGWYLYDSTQHIPLIIRHPDAKEEPQVVDAMRGSVDLFPTLVDLAGLDSSVLDLPGQSMAAAVLGEGHIESSPFVVSETDWRSVNKTAIRTEEHILIQNDGAAAHQTDGRFEGKKLDWVEKKILANTPPVEFYANSAMPTDVGQSHSLDEISAEMVRDLENWKTDYPIRSPIGRDAKDGTTHSDGTFVSSPFIETNSAPPMDDDVAEQLKSLGYLGDEPEE